MATVATAARCFFRLSVGNAFHCSHTIATNVSSRITPWLFTRSASATGSSTRPRPAQHLSSSPLATMLPPGAQKSDRSTRPSVSRLLVSTTLVQDKRCNVLCNALSHSALHAGPTRTPHIVPSRPYSQQHSSWSQLPALMTHRSPSQPHIIALRIPGIPQQPIPTAPKQYWNAHGVPAPSGCAERNIKSARSSSWEVASRRRQRVSRGPIAENVYPPKVVKQVTRRSGRCLSLGSVAAAERLRQTC
jgi:hypothetical protein